MKKTLTLTKIIAGIKKPDTGRTVTLRDITGASIATATETPANSGQYVATYSEVAKYGYWYVDGVQKDGYSNNSPFWLGIYNAVSASSVDAPTIKYNGTDINTAGALSNVAYENQANVFTANQTVSASLTANQVYTKNSPVYNVKAYGALGDGATDDYDAILAAITACSASAYGGVVYFPAGEYKTRGGWDIFPNMTIKGDGREATKISSINYGAGETFNSGSTTAFFSGTDVDNVVFKDFWLRGVSIDGSSAQGIVLDLSTASNTAHIIMENLLITDMCSNSAVYINTPILTTLINVKVLRNAGIGFHFVDGTSTDLYECYSITNTEAGFFFDTMTYCCLNGCASEVSGIGFDFKSCSAIVLNGCGTEAILNRYSAFERYGYGNRGQLRGTNYDGFAYRSRSSHIQLNSCYSRDPDVGHTSGSGFDKINSREFTLHVTQPTVGYNGNNTGSYEGVNRTTLFADITSASSTLTVAVGTGVNFPTASFTCSIYTATYSSSYSAWNSSNPPTIRSEVFYVATRAGDVFSGLTRGQYNGTADYWTAGAKVELASKYNYAVSFFSGSEETEISGYPYRGFHNLAEIVLTNIPTDPNGVALGRRLYRTKANGHILYPLWDISDNTTTTFTDTIPDTMLTGSSKSAPRRITAADIGTNVITIEENLFVDGDKVMVDKDDGVTPPAPLWTSNYYTVTESSGNTLKLIASGSVSVVDITSTGTGTWSHLYLYTSSSLDIANKYLTSITGSITSASYAEVANSAYSAASAIFAATAATAATATSASFATTASYAMNGGGSVDTSSFVQISQTSSMTVLSSSYAVSASYAPMPDLTPYVLTSATASMTVLSSSYATTASYAANAGIDTSSFAKKNADNTFTSPYQTVTSSTAVYLTLRGGSDGDNFAAVTLSSNDGGYKWQFAQKISGDFGFTHYNGGWSTPFVIKDNGTVSASGIVSASTFFAKNTASAAYLYANDGYIDAFYATSIDAVGHINTARISSSGAVSASAFNLNGVDIGSIYQPINSNLTGISTITIDDYDFITAEGGFIVNKNASQVRSILNVPVLSGSQGFIGNQVITGSLTVTGISYVAAHSGSGSFLQRFGNDTDTFTIIRKSATGRAQISFTDETGSGSYGSAPGEMWRFGTTGAGSTNFSFYDGTGNVITMTRGSGSVQIGRDLSVTGSGNFNGNLIVTGTLAVSSSTFPVAKITRMNTETNTVKSTFQAIHQTTGDMVDGFGTDISFGIRDSAGVDNEIANFAGVRDGADNSGALVFYTRVTGTKTERLKITSAGKTTLTASSTTTSSLLIATATATAANIRGNWSGTGYWGIGGVATTVRIAKTDIEGSYTGDADIQVAAVTASGAVTSTQFKLSALNTAPASAAATGTLGEVKIDASYIYVCTATNTWKRAAIATW